VHAAGPGPWRLADGIRLIQPGGARLGGGGAGAAVLYWWVQTRIYHWWGLVVSLVGPGMGKVVSLVGPGCLSLVGPGCISLGVCVDGGLGEGGCGIGEHAHDAACGGLIQIYAPFLWHPQWELGQLAGRQWELVQRAAVLQPVVPYRAATDLAACPRAAIRQPTSRTPTRTWSPA